MYLEFKKGALRGYTRLDLLFAIATVGLLGTLGLSVLGSGAVRNDIVVCANNLRQVGRAFHMWASDHGGENPWWVSYAEGGAYIRYGEPAPPLINVPGLGPVPAGLRNNVWFQFGFISQELRSPAVLVCPTDRAKARAEEFSNVPGKGYFALDFQHRATSYFIGAHAVSLFPSAMLSGDRSIKEDAVNASCVVNMGVMSRIDLNGSKTWNTELHPSGGNLLANDGRVEELSPGGLTRFIDRPASENGSSHLVKPH